MLVETAYAKINLALHVRGREADGYHRLETLFAFAADGDRLTLADADALTLACTGPFAGELGGDDNLVLRAARDFAAAFGVTAKGAFRLDKRLPVASGIGGGSADAAAALRLLCRRHDVAMDERVLALARALGADVAACVASVPVRGEGRGDMLAAVDNDLAGTPMLLVNPGVALSTGPVFRAWDGVDRGALATGNMMQVACGGRNDLAAPALTLAPAIGTVLDRLGTLAGVTLARMSGSGATCFALFADIAARDAADAALADTGWWRLASVLR